MLRVGSVKNEELQLQKKDGTSFTGTVSAVVVKDESDEVKYYDGIIEDITERRRAEEAQFEALARFSGFAEASQYGMGMADLDGHIVYVNSTLARMLGEKTPDDCLGKHFPTTYYPPLMTAKLQKEVMPALMQDGYWHGELELLTTNGRCVPTDENYFVIRDETGKPFYLADILTDITGRKQAEDELREKEERLSSFMNLASDSFHLLDSNLNFVEINKKGLEIMGKRKDEVIVKNITKIVPNLKESGRYEKHIEVLRTGKAFEIDHFVPHPVFGDLHFIMKSFKVGEDLGVIATDITDRIRIEQERRKFQAQLVQAQKMEAIGTLAGGIAHDFNNILSPIIGNTELAMMDVGDDNRIQLNLKETMKAALRAKDLVQQILTFSRQREQQLIPVQMSIIIQEISKLLRSTIPTTIDVQYRLETEIDTVLADPTQIHQVIELS